MKWKLLRSGFKLRTTEYIFSGDNRYSKKKQPNKQKLALFQRTDNRRDSLSFESKVF